MPDQKINYLVFIVISQAQSKEFMTHLSMEEFFFTIIDSHSSLFHESTMCLLIGLHHQRLDQLEQLVQEYCQPYQKFIPVQLHSLGELSHMPVLESMVGGATLYGIPIEQFEQF